MFPALVLYGYLDNSFVGCLLCVLGGGGGGGGILIQAGSGLDIV